MEYVRAGLPDVLTFKDVLADAIYISDLYEVEVATARVQPRYPHLTEDTLLQAQEREERIDKEVNQSETRRSTQKYFRLGYQIRGHVKPNSMKKLSLNIPNVQMEDGLWRQIVGNDKLEEHLVERNGEQFSHAGTTHLGYTEHRHELDHTDDTPMTEDILDVTFKHVALSDNALLAIVKQLRKHPTLRQIIQPIIPEADFKSAFKYVPEKTASSFSGRGITTWPVIKAKKMG
jgi:hypothetical protein